eukprot:scaffold5487_cov153-Skeletonema_marinoi.AAC.21
MPLTDAACAVSVYTALISLMGQPCSISFPASPAPQRIFEPPQHKKATDNGDPNTPMPMHHQWIYHPKPPPPTVVGRYQPIMSEA